MGRIANSKLGHWLNISQSAQAAQIRLLLTSFGLSTALLYLSTEILGKIAAQVRSLR